MNALDNYLNQIDILYKQFLLSNNKDDILNIADSLDYFKYFFKYFVSNNNFYRKMSLMYLRRPIVMRYISKKNKEYDGRFLSNVMENRKLHYNISREVLSYLEEVFPIVFSLDSIDELKIEPSTREYNKISWDELSLLVNGFYQEKDKDGLVLYNYLFSNNRILRVGNIVCENNYDITGVTISDIYNNLEFIWLPKLGDNSFDVTDVFDIVHEVGHVEDLIRYHHLSNKEKYEYTRLSVFIEVNSFYKECMLYDYLIENNIYKEDVLDFYKSNLLVNFDNLINQLGYFYMNDSTLGVRSKNSFVDRKILEYIKKCRGNFDILSTICNTYGFIISTYLSENREYYYQFIKSNYKEFNKKDLNDLGVNNNNVISSYQKKLERYKLI